MDAQRVIITVFSAGDADGDGMDDTWEMDRFGTRDRDGRGDFDRDGISDLDEFLLGTDPAAGDSAPAAPVILSPGVGAGVTVVSPALTVENSVDPENDPVTYTFEVFSDPAMTEPVAGAAAVTEGAGSTSWTVSQALDDNHWYFWRVRAADHTGSSLWVYGKFFVNTRNDAPGGFAASRPADASHVGTVTPVLEVTNSRDPDGDPVTYAFEVYADADMAQPAGSCADVPEGPGGTTSWAVDTPLADNTVYYWRAVATDTHGARAETALFSFDVDTANTPPAAPEILSPASGSEVGQGDADLGVSNATDADGDPLTYDFERDRVNTFDSPEKHSSADVPEGVDSTTWHVAGLADNTIWFWRVRSNDGSARSPWATAMFFVNMANDPPPGPGLRNPGENAWVRTANPSLSVNPVPDPDHDAVTYCIEVYSDASLTRLVDRQTSADGTVVVSGLSDLTRYYWRARAEDEHGLSSGWGDPTSFFVKTGGVNTPPGITVTRPSGDVITNSDTVMIEWEDHDPDSNAVISIYYDTDGTGEDGTLIVSGIPEDPSGASDSYAWRTADMEGTWYIYAVIADERSSATSYATGAVTLDRTPPTVLADPPGGTYSGPLNVTLTARETSTIYYSLDGTTPTTESAVWNMPIAISGTVALAFMAVDAAGNRSAVVTEHYTVEEPQAFSVMVSTDAGTPIGGVNVYAFTDAGAYTGASAVTDADGSAVFDPNDFTEGDYRFRADYLGGRFWSDAVTIPGTGGIDLVIDMETVDVTVSTAAGVSEGTTVYLFSEAGSYLGRSAVTDAAGQARFDLPVGRGFRFRSDILGRRYWSDPVTVTAGGTHAVAVDAGGGTLEIAVREDESTPLTGIRVYLFTEAGSYLNRNGVTDGSGHVAFDVSEGTYKVRADHLGYRFWSAALPVEADTAAVLTVPHRDVTVTVNGVFADPEPMEGLPVYLFTEAGAYMNRNGVTDMNGRVVFHVPARAYKVRADYLGQQYWSGSFTGVDTEMEIPLADASVTVGWRDCGLPGVPVYVFTPAGAYLNRTDSTDTEGRVTFRLPAGTYKFRADYQAGRYWSQDAGLQAGQANPVEISTGGGSFSFTVVNGASEPVSGLNCYVFGEGGAYFGVYGPTNSEGTVSFDLADGIYDIRIDYLGYRFWSRGHHVPETLSDSFVIDHQDVAVIVSSRFQAETAPLEGLTVYLFSPSGAYLNRSRVTDADGRVVFSLPNRDYKVRADYLGQQYWSGSFAGEDAAVEIPMADAGVVVTGAGQALEGVPVYVFTPAGAYLNTHGATDADGRVTFRLPAGTYKFRADYQNSRYWSDEKTLIADEAAPVGISTGGGTFSLTVRKNAAEPLVGVRAYVFSGRGAYLGLTATTSSEGLVSFDLADGSYKIRVDYLGYPFWTDIYTVPDSLADTFVIPHAEVTVTVEGLYLTREPMEGLKVYLFTPGGAYMRRNRVTDAGGHVVFSLPDRDYRVRADELGQKFWSEDFRSQDTMVTIHEGLARVHVRRSGADVAGAKIYLFSESGAYLGRYEVTDASGYAAFVLPDAAFKFRADEGGDQVYSDTVEITAGQVNEVEIGLE